MKWVIFDTSFILSCAKERIHFIDDVLLLGLKIIIPEEVIGELEKVERSGKRLKLREEAKLAIRILNLNKSTYKKIEIGEGHVDKLLINYAKANPEVVVATLDRGIKKAVINNKLVIRNKKSLEII